MTVAERQRRHRLLKAQQQETNMSDAVLELKVPPPLPETRRDLMEQYKLKRRRSINDFVEEIIIKLWESDHPEFTKYVEAIYDSQAIEGSMDDDDVMAALIIRDTAKKDKSPVADHNVHTIKLAMRVALRRFDLGRGQRYELAKLPLPQAETQAQSPPAAE